MRAGAGLLAAVLLTACGAAERPGPDRAYDPEVTDWRAVASDDAAERLETLDTAWAQALAAADADDIAAIGPALDPSAAIATRPLPPVGEYACTSYSLLADGGLSRLSATCAIERPSRSVTLFVRRFTMQPQTGRVFTGDPLGPVLVDDRANRVGVFQRIGADQWRVVFPSPSQTSSLYVVVVGG